MSKTSIEWATDVWNPVTGCQKISAGCAHCYAETIAKRFWGERKFTDVQCHPERLDDPLRWRKPRRVFVNSMSDLFHPDVPFDFIDKVFAVMGRCQHHTFMVLTKRPGRMLEYFRSPNLYRRVLDQAYKLDGRHLVSDDGLGIGISNLAETAWALPNVWLGVTAENQQAADERIPLLLQTPAAVRFVSVEPMLGKIDLQPWVTPRSFGELVDLERRNRKAAKSAREIFTPVSRTIDLYGKPYTSEFLEPVKLDWVICGQESGPGARINDLDDIRNLRDQCVSAGVRFFLKQIYLDGKMVKLPELDGQTWAQFPEVT